MTTQKCYHAISIKAKLNIPNIQQLLIIYATLFNFFIKLYKLYNVTKNSHSTVLKKEISIMILSNHIISMIFN